MLRITLLLLSVLNVCITGTSFAQEFQEYSDGLIYSQHTMDKLRRIVDSENLKYRKCDPWKDYYSFPQASCHFVSMDSTNVKSALTDIKNNIGFDSFIKKYPEATVQKNLRVLKEKLVNYENIVKVRFSTIEMDKFYSRTIYCSDTTLLNKKLNGNWVFNYSPKTEYSSEYISAFYFTTDFISIKIPEKYARMIQYSDCMIDTNSSILLPHAKESYREFYQNQSKKSKKTPARKKLSEYLSEYTGEPKRKKFRVDSIYELAYETWYVQKDSIVENELANNVEFKSLLKSAIDEALKAGISDDELESLAFKYDTKDRTLQLKRGRIVVGGCSQDSRPRVHAQQIAVLAAETVNWSIFLRAHLDIMNDRFRRVSDGSYAWARRNTYIKELEQLNLDVTPLLLGIALRIENPSGNHYFGSIGRLGRALSESGNSDQIEKEMFDAIQDNQLDDFNRVVIYYLCRNYIFNLSDSTKKEKVIEKLAMAINTFSENFKGHFEVIKSDFEKNN